MLALSSQVTSYLISNRLIPTPVAEPVRLRLQSVYDWWQQLVAGHGISTEIPGRSLDMKLEALLGQLELNVRQSPSAREDLRFQVNRQMPELIRHLNWVIKQVEQDDLSPRVLILVEGLDKVDLESARNIFREHAPTITAPAVSMIYTFPIALRHSDHFNAVRLSFPVVEFLPNIRVHNFDGTSNDAGCRTLRNLVLARIEEELIEQKAMELLIMMSGGVPVWLVKLVRSSALYALERQAQSIACGDVENAVRDLRRDTLAPLNTEDYNLLSERHRDHRFTTDPQLERLLDNGSLIEYPNHVPWCDAHPALWPLLNRKDDETKK